MVHINNRTFINNTFNFRRLTHTYQENQLTNFNRSFKSLVKLTVSQLILKPAPRGSGGQKPLHINVGGFCSTKEKPDEG